MPEGTPDTSEPMDPFDYLMYRGEHDPATRSSMAAAYVLDGTPQWYKVRQAFDQASRSFLRLRQHVVQGVGGAQWVVDPDFDLSYHVRRAAVPAPGGMDQLLTLVEGLLMAPLDTARPLWEAILYEGLEGDRAALVVKASHSITDGIGGIRLNTLLFDEEREAPSRPLPALPIGEDVTSDELLRRAVRTLPMTAGRGLVRGIGGAARVGIAVARRPQRTLGDAVDYVQSAQRVLAPTGEPSPLIGGRSASRRVLWTEVPLDDLRRAAKAAGGSLNDAYLAALTGALGRYHERLGMPVESVPMAVPISIRPVGDAVGGNHFAGTSFAAPVSEPDPVKRIVDIGGTMRAARAERALTLMSVAAPVLSRLPSRISTGLSKRMAAPDVQASNIPGHRGDVFFGGCKIDKALGFGPLPGCAIMVVLLSHGDTCFITGHYDPAAITEPELFAECLRQGLDEVLQLGTPAEAEPGKPRQPSAAATGATDAPT